MLPLNLSTDDGLIFVNAKQYHRIIRRRKSRAKAELKHKLSRNRKFSPDSQKVMITSEDSKISIFDGINIVHKYRGYFMVDKDSTSDKLVFNRIVTLRVKYAKGGK